jgi:hypothetical protein
MLGASPQLEWWNPSIWDFGMRIADLYLFTTINQIHQFPLNPKSAFRIRIPKSEIKAIPLFHCSMIETKQPARLSSFVEVS